GGRGRRVAVDRVLVARGDPGSPLVRLGVLDPELEAAGATTTGDTAARVVGGRAVALRVVTLRVTAAVAADVLLQRLVLIRLRLVRDVRRGGGRRVLRRRARAGRHVAAGDRDGHVGVDRVLVALREARG